MAKVEAFRAIGNNPERRGDGIIIHFKNLLRVKKALNGAIDDVFREYPFLEQEGANGLTPAQRVRRELENEERVAHLRRAA